MNILISNINAVTMCGDNPYIENCNIGITDDIISFVSCDVPKDFKADYKIDGKNGIALPGFVNTHCHIPMTLLRSYSDGYPLYKWLFEKIFPVEAKLDDDAVYWGSMLGLSEMIASGTTTYADMYFFTDAIARATDKAGLRANISHCLSNDSITSGFSDNDRVLEALDKTYKWNSINNGRIKFDISAHAPYTSNEYFLKSVAELAEKLNLGMQVHVAETKDEFSEISEKYGKTPTKFLYDLGYFKTRTVAAHSVYLTEDDINIYRDNNVFVAHNPTSNLKLGSGIANIKHYMDEGLAITLGTDGASSNNNLNMWEELNLAALLITGTNFDPASISTFDMLKMATVNGAKALGRKNLGTLSRGSLADIQILSADAPHLYPRHDVLSLLCFSAQAHDVNTVIVGGNIIYENKEFKTLDFEEIKFNVDKVCKRLF